MSSVVSLVFAYANSLDIFFWFTRVNSSYSYIFCLHICVTDACNFRSRHALTLVSTTVVTSANTSVLPHVILVRNYW